MLNLLLYHLEQDLLPERQYGFRAGRGGGTVDMPNLLHEILQEKY